MQNTIAMTRRDIEQPPKVQLLFLPGLLSSPALYKPLLPHMPKGRYDAQPLPLPGHFPSDITGRLLRSAIANNNLLATLTSRLPDVDQLVLIGHSTGGLMSLQIAARFPERVAAVVLIGALYGRPGIISTHSRLLGLPVIAPLLSRHMLQSWIRSPESFRRGLATVCRDQRLSIDRVPLDMLDDMAKSNPVDLLTMARWVRDQDFSRNLCKVHCPVLNILCADDPVINPAHQMDFAQLLRNCQTVLIRTGHLPMLEDPARLARIMTGWLDTIARDIRMPGTTLH